MTRLRLLIVLLPMTLALAACSSDETNSANNVDSNGNAVSSVPWNKPESWETQGQLGSMTGQ